MRSTMHRTGEQHPRLFLVVNSGASRFADVLSVLAPRTAATASFSIEFFMWTLPRWLFL